MIYVNYMCMKYIYYCRITIQKMALLLLYGALAHAGQMRNNPQPNVIVCYLNKESFRITITCSLFIRPSGSRGKRKY